MGEGNSYAKAVGGKELRFSRDKGQASEQWHEGLG